MAKLSLEKELAHVKLCREVDSTDDVQLLKQFIKEMHRQSLVKDQLYAQMFKDLK